MNPRDLYLDPLSNMLWEAAERGMAKIKPVAEAEGWLATYEHLEAYVFKAQTPDDFLWGVLASDIYLAATKANPVNAKHLVSIVQNVVWHLPAQAYGSGLRVVRWIEAVGARRYLEHLNHQKENP